MPMVGLESIHVLDVGSTYMASFLVLLLHVSHEVSIDTLPENKLGFHKSPYATNK